MSTLVGAIEAGGTKFVCAVGSGPDDLREEVRFPTTSPAETIGRCVDYFRQQQGKHGPLAAVGIAAFGPVDPDPHSPTFGFITTTPKPGWANTDFAGHIRRELDLPVGFDTDVNVAAIGEGWWGAGRDLDAFIYLTIGTGIGGGGLINGRPLHGMIHPEMGHIRLPRDAKTDSYTGNCPYHGDCLEGLASGPAIEKRWGVPATELPPEHPAWKLEAEYLALAVSNFVCTLSPRRVILGGGVMEQEHLFPMVRSRVQELLANYVQSPNLLESIGDYIVPPMLGNRAGILGSVALAQQVVEQTGQP